MILLKEKKQQRKEKAATAAQQRKKAAAYDYMNLDKHKDEVEKQHEEVVDILENQYEQSIGQDAGRDWKDWTEVTPTDPYNTNLTLQQRLVEDFDLNPDKSDEEDDTSSVAHSKRGLSPPVDPSPSKVFKQSECPATVQPVKRDEREMAIKFLPT